MVSAAPQGDAIRLFNYVRCVRDAGNTSVPGGEDADEVGSVGFAPNPFRDSTELRLTLPAGVESATCTIHDVSGRAVRTLTATTVGTDQARFVWDGRAYGGDAVAAGIYFAEVAVGADTARSRLVVLR